MEITQPRRIAAVTVLAPITWGTTYVTVTELLPGGRPLFVAAIRVLPAGVVLLFAGRWQSSWRPRGRQWGTTAVLAPFNFALFFPLLIVGVTACRAVAAAFGGLQPLPHRYVVMGDRRAAAPCGRNADRSRRRGGAGSDTAGRNVRSRRPPSPRPRQPCRSPSVVLTKLIPAAPNRLASTGWQLLIGGVPLRR